MRARWLGVALVVAFLVGSCAPVATGGLATPSLAPSSPRTDPPTPSLPLTPSPAPTVADLLARIDAGKLNDHLQALAGVVSRDPRHPGHAKALAYLKEQLGAIPGVEVSTFRNVYQGIALESVLATIDPPGPVSPTGWVIAHGHYDSIANRTPAWRPALDPAPGADDNGTGTAGLLEVARVVAGQRTSLAHRVVVAFFDGEELFFKGSGAYVASLPKPLPYVAAINLDMVGFNPIADRLDLLWYTSGSAALRDRVVRANDTYRIGVSPLNAQFAADGSTIMDAAPFGVAGIPSIALCQRYGESDATFPGNFTFHTVNDTPDKVTNRRLWLKATQLALAVTLELARQI